MSGRYGQLAAVVVPGTGVLTHVYTCGGYRQATINISITNTADTSTDIRLVHIKNDVLANVAEEDFLLGSLTTGFPTSALAHNMAPFEKNNLILGAGDQIAVSSSSNKLSVQVNGHTEDS